MEFVGTLPAANLKNGKVKVKRTLTNFQSLDISKLRSFDEDIYLPSANVEFNLKGNVSVFTAAVLSRRFKRTGFEGRNISLLIPVSISADDREKFIDRIGKCVDSKSANKVKSLIEKGIDGTIVSYLLAHTSVNTTSKYYIQKKTNIIKNQLNGIKTLDEKL
jgi:hypothetical protein